MTYHHIRVEPLATPLGAEIGGIDLATPLPDPVLAEIRQAFGEHGVIFFRDQELTPEQHLAFARRFGGVDVNRFFTAVPGYPMIAEVREEPAQRQNIGNGWHTDHSYDLAPAMGSMLYAREVPTSGGDTLFASMYAACDALSDGLKATLEGLKAFEPPCLRRRGPRPSRRPEGPHRQPGVRHTGRHPPCRDPPSGDWPQSALCQSGFHPTLRRMDRRGITPVARIPVPARGPSRVHHPLPLAPRVARLLGQPLGLAFCGQRLPRECRLLHRITIEGVPLN